MWSANRDQSCGVNYANPEVVSGQCSGVDQQPGAYSAIFDTFVPRRAAGPRGPSTGRPARPSRADATRRAASAADAWSTTRPPRRTRSGTPSGAYPKNTKIVWHHNVYEAKWWTEGDVPDAPVTRPDRHPVGPDRARCCRVSIRPPLPTLSAGTYPDWDAATVYVAGQRVLFDGVGYQAKWWNQDQPPVAESAASGRYAVAVAH